MKKAITSVAIGAILTVGIGSQAWALGNVNTTLNNNMNKYDNRRSDNSNNQRFGNGATLDSNNRTTTTTNRNDNRDLSNRSVSTDNRDYSNRSVTDSSNRSINTDSRDYSNRSTNTDSHNQDYSNHSRQNSHDIKGNNNKIGSYEMGANSIMVQGGYAPRVGHEKVDVGNMSGSNNYIDNSTAGNFGIGHTLQK